MKLYTDHGREPKSLSALKYYNRKERITKFNYKYAALLL